MKFSMLIHMERFTPDRSYRQHFEDMLELIHMAEDAGFETVWIGEHHAIEFTISPNPLQTLAFLARETSNIRLGSGVVTAPFWHPIRLAEEIAMVDIMSNGRVEVGLGRGAYQFEFDRMAGGMPGVDGGRYLREMVPLLPRLWEGDWEHDGECWQFPSATSVPKPIQKFPPLWIAARDQDTHNFTVLSRCNTMATPLSKPDEEVLDLTEKFKRAVAEYGDGFRPRLMMLRHTFVYDDPDDWAIPVNGMVHFGRHFENLFKNISKVSNGFPEAVSYQEVINRDDYDPERIRNNQMFGLPDEIVPRIRQYGEWGVDQYCYWADNGLPHEQKKKSLELFCTEVVPEFRD